MRYLVLAIVAATALSCDTETPHPGYSPGIEEHVGVRDLYGFAEMYRTKLRLPALGVGIIRDGRIHALGMAGVRRAGSEDWATLADLFDVASISKPATATVAALLVQRGEVRWEMTIQEVFPELKGSVHPDYLNVTLEMLLRHRSGLEQRMHTNARWAAWHRDRSGVDATEKRRQFTAEALAQPPRYKPGTDAYYANDGYIVAGSMIERITGRAWEELARDLLFTPLGLHRTIYGVPPSHLGPLVWGHEDGRFSWGSPVKPDPGEYGDPPFGAPAGFLYSTVTDLLRFVDLQIQAADGRSNLLSQDVAERLLMPLEKEHFAIGWEVETTAGEAGAVAERSVYHGGYSGRFRANIWFSPESRTGTVIVYNHGGSDQIDAYVEIFYALLKEI